MPFLRPDGPGTPDIVLKQVGPNLFQLLQGFRYQVPHGPLHVVPPHDPSLPATAPDNSTDLASVPFWLWWFVASHGRHTPAALLHDHLVDATDSTASRRIACSASRSRSSRSGGCGAG